MTKKTFIIAEAGVNHNGDVRLAYKMIDEAAKAGVDAVKFQTFITEEVISKYAQKADYQKNNTPSGETQFEMVKKLELSHQDFVEIKKYCEKKGVIFLSTPFDLVSLSFLNSIGLNTIKIASGEITNLPLLRAIGELRKNVILSTGMSTLGEIEFALSVLREHGAKAITVLHCNTQYPTPCVDVNLNAMVTIKNAFKVEVGYSDHTEGIEVPIAAVAMGAVVIEKHFTLDKSMEGPDHKASLEPNELKKLVGAIRNVENALGDGIKQISDSESKNKKIARKSIVARKPINVGEIYAEENLTTKRPGEGISPMHFYEVLGKVANRSYLEDEMIEM